MAADKNIKCTSEQLDRFDSLMKSQDKLPTARFEFLDMLLNSYENKSNCKEVTTQKEVTNQIDVNGLLEYSRSIYDKIEEHLTALAVPQGEVIEIKQESVNINKDNKKIVNKIKSNLDWFLENTNYIPSLHGNEVYSKIIESKMLLNDIV